MSIRVTILRRRVWLPLVWRQYHNSSQPLTSAAAFRARAAKHGQSSILATAGTDDLTLEAPLRIAPFGHAPERNIQNT